MKHPGHTYGGFVPTILERGMTPDKPRVRPGKLSGKAGLTRSGTCPGRTRVRLRVTHSGSDSGKVLGSDPGKEPDTISGKNLGNTLGYDSGNGSGKVTGSNSGKESGTISGKNLGKHLGKKSG
jgi:hypothetical protein